MAWNSLLSVRFSKIPNLRQGIRTQGMLPYLKLTKSAGNGDEKLLQIKDWRCRDYRYFIFVTLRNKRFPILCETTKNTQYSSLKQVDKLDLQKNVFFLLKI